MTFRNDAQLKKELIICIIFAIIIVILSYGIIDVRNFNNFLNKQIELETIYKTNYVKPKIQRE